MHEIPASRGKADLYATPVRAGAAPCHQFLLFQPFENVRDGRLAQAYPLRQPPDGRPPDLEQFTQQQDLGARQAVTAHQLPGLQVYGANYAPEG